jgi:hypothetical protein
MLVFPHKNTFFNTIVKAICSYTTRVMITVQVIHTEFTVERRLTISHYVCPILTPLTKPYVMNEATSFHNSTINSILIYDEVMKGLLFYRNIMSKPVWKAVGINERH